MPVPPVSDEWRSRRHKKKDTARWCAGHEGREHQPEVVLDHNLTSFIKTCYVGKASRLVGQVGEMPDVWRCIHVTRCSVCGRILDQLGGKTVCPDKPASMPYCMWKEHLNAPAAA